ncbi:uncharacterized protein LOC144435733 [Glandiceps talaboti]
MKFTSTAVFIVIWMITMHGHVGFAKEFTKFTSIGKTETLECPYRKGKQGEQTQALSLIRWEDAHSGRFIGHNMLGVHKYIDTYKYSIHNASLTIRNINLSDESIYQCTVVFENANGKSEQRLGIIRLNIYIPFNASFDSSGVDTKEKTKFSATCKTTMGRPQTTFTWYFNDQLISNYSDAQVRILDQCEYGFENSYNCSSKLDIDEVEIGHTGKYTCRAEISGMETNKITEKTFSLDVKPDVEELSTENGEHSFQSSTQMIWLFQIFVNLILQMMISARETT